MAHGTARCCEPGRRPAPACGGYLLPTRVASAGNLTMKELLPQERILPNGQIPEGLQAAI